MSPDPVPEEAVEPPLEVDQPREVLIRLGQIESMLSELQSAIAALGDLGSLTRVINDLAGRLAHLEQQLEPDRDDLPEEWIGDRPGRAPIIEAADQVPAVPPRKTTLASRVSTRADMLHSIYADWSRSTTEDDMPIPVIFHKMAARDPTLTESQFHSLLQELRNHRMVDLIPAAEIMDLEEPALGIESTEGLLYYLCWAQR